MSARVEHLWCRRKGAEPEAIALVAAINEPIWSEKTGYLTGTENPQVKILSSQGSYFVL